MRTELLSAITTAISTLTQFAVSQELPWEQNGIPLFIKNMKKIYVDQEQMQETVLIETLDARDLFEDEYTCQVYFSVDSKNPPSQTDLLVSNILGCKDNLGIVNHGSESDYTLEKQEDRLIYTIEFRLLQATT